MQITALKREKQHLTRLFADNGEEILLDNDVCAENSLKIGTVMDSERLAELRLESDYKRAKSRALWYLDRADHTEKALYTKLTRAGFSGRASAAVIARFRELGVIDDRRFAENYAERCAAANISKRQTLSKMLAKGVPYELANEVLSEVETDESAQIMSVIEKKYARKLSEENGTEKVYAALIRRGFSFSAVREALKKYSEELEYSEE